jgi:microcystin-dependent protein
VLAATQKKAEIYAPGTATQALSATSVAPAGPLGSTSQTTNTTGGGQPVATMPPFLGLKCIIATQGVFPARD